LLHSDVEAKGVIDLNYAGPTYRLGQIYSLLRRVGTERAEMVGDTLKDNWTNMFKELSDPESSFGLSGVAISSTSEKTPIIFKDDGVVVLFPEISARISADILILLRPSVTVCIPPNRSKIWVRISYLGKEVLGDAELERFFTKSQELSVKIANYFLNYYKSSLKQNSVKANLEKQHEIKIETAAGNLEKTSELLKSHDFKLKDLFNNNASEELHGAFRRIFGCEVNSLEELKALSSDNQWFKINRTNDVDLLGICSKQHGVDSSKYICTMHNSGEFEIQPYLITKVSSKLLLHQIIIGV
jgi:hypothetical protein